MISVEEAKRIMMAHAHPLGADLVALASSGSGYVIEDVFAGHDHPLFDMSAVDGFAFMFAEGSKEWKVVGEVPAGGTLSHALRTGECARIFTGAMIPVGADTVVMQEFVARAGDRISHSDSRLNAGGNVRRKGEQLHAGDLILSAGAHLNAAAKGLLASAGVASVQMVPTPEVTVIITGNEFADERTLLPGRIFSSNDVMLDSLLKQAGAIAEIERVPDDAAALEQAIRAGAGGADIVITTGGASVGDHDLVLPVLEHLGATIHVHGVAQKPGKPMLFATLNGKPVFGLPGNPRAVMVLFWEYVLPFLRAMQGAKDPWLKTDALPITHAIEIKGDRTEFRAAQVKGGKVTLLRDEGSHMLRSLVEADALAVLPAGRRSWAEGEPLEVHYIPR